MMKKKIAVLHYAFLKGGAESLCAWTLQALQNDFDVTLFTLADININILNEMYGTNVEIDRISVKSFFPDWVLPLVEYYYSNFCFLNAVSYHIFMRYFKKFKDSFDLIISTYNEMDFGKKGIQYIHYPGMVQSRIRGIISNFSDARMKSNISLTNSEFTRNVISEMYDITSHIIRPPVFSDFPNICWKDKELGFICSARLAQQKDIEGIIEILRKVRHRGYKIHLHVTYIGYNKKYEKRIKKLQKDYSTWITLHKNMNRKEYIQLLAQHKFSIHNRKEPFGIVVAEQLEAGCIPFVRDIGGQVEIIGHHNFLMFKNKNEAVKKIVSMLSSKGKQKEMLHFLTLRAKQFSQKKFMAEMRAVVLDFFKKIKKPDKS
jgi:glycosyltransferase involved in cell wall biosynthesis